MFYGKINKNDIANGPGCRVTLFVSGCRNHCKGCFQPETWSFKYGTEYTGDTQKEILDALSKSYIQGLTLLGGDPFEPENQKVLIGLLREVKGMYPNKDIWAYSGYKYETLISDKHPHTDVTDEMLTLIDILVDGKFEISKKNLMLSYRGSENQRIINLRETEKYGYVSTIPDSVFK